MRDEINYLRTLSSEDAFQWTIQNHPNLSPSIAYCSWAVREQESLLRYYLPGKMPFASRRGYDWLLQATSPTRLVKHITVLLSTVPLDRLELLTYHLTPALSDAAKTERQRREAGALIEKITALRVRKYP